MPRVEARGGMATGDRAVATERRRVRLPSKPSPAASAQFRLALPQMPRAEARGASLVCESKKEAEVDINRFFWRGIRTKH